MRKPCIGKEVDFDKLLSTHPDLSEFFPDNDKNPTSGPFGSYKYKFKMENLMPGDQAHIDNPNWTPRPNADPGMMGTNKIYVCASMGFIDPYGEAYYTFSEMQEAVQGYAGGQGNLGNYPMDKCFCPRIPDVCK